MFDQKTGLTAREKTFTRAQLLAAVANALEYGIDAEPGSLERLCDDVLEVVGYAVRVPALGSTVMSSTARYTTQDILDAEESVRVQALGRFDSGTAQHTAEQAAAAVDVFQVAAGFELSPEQQAAVTRVLAAGHGIDALVGVAGAGKSTLMEACRIGCDATGTTYAGATFAGTTPADVPGPASIRRAGASPQVRGVGRLGVQVVAEAEVGGDLFQRDARLANVLAPHDVLAELLRIRIGVLQHPSRPPLSKPGQVSPIPAAVPVDLTKTVAVTAVEDS
ncbi:AAA family ATPase [Streptomyces tendae]|uniref:AAA family ATPase n=1 Tax=Streptomyces tendae TaxID=1932 RepID=UPI0036BC5120